MDRLERVLTVAAYLAALAAAISGVHCSAFHANTHDLSVSANDENPFQLQDGAHPNAATDGSRQASKVFGGGGPGDAPTLRLAAAAALAIPAALLGVVTLVGLIAYFAFMPSPGAHAHLFSRVHANYMIHPFTTSLVMGLLSLSVYCAAPLAWASWGVFCLFYLLLTGLYYHRWIRNERAAQADGCPTSAASTLLNLIVGGELMTIAGGAKPLPPWRLRALPGDAWIVDVRTKPEFHWNRLQAAENYPWGQGVIEAAAARPKDRPVLVVCLSGHRSPHVAAQLRRLGFESVYNLNWGMLYLMLLERGRKAEGPLSLTRPQRDPDRRGEDLRQVAQAYVALLFLTLLGAPAEYWISGRSISMSHAAAGAGLVGVGLALGAKSFKALGRNFRIYAAPRRSGSLITSGVYSVLRHPMYTGVVVALAGYVLFFGSLLFVPVWCAALILYLVKAAKEEDILSSKFPEYQGYCRRTWRFLPYIY